MPERYSIDQYVEDLRRITANCDDESEVIAKVSPLAQRMAADGSWLEDRFFHPDSEVGFSSFLLHEEEDHSLAVIAVSWAPGMMVVPHDHGTWAVVVGVEGIDRNIRYKRLDDRTNPEYAKLAIKEEMNAGPGDLVCMRTEGIHSVHNDGETVTLSFHTYGVHLNHVKRHQFDLSNNIAKDFKVYMQ
jgi:predicted metal-dependent enzyme (double-stranded beta helix superfamily)